VLSVANRCARAWIETCMCNDRKYSVSRKWPRGCKEWADGAGGSPSLLRGTGCELREGARRQSGQSGGPCEQSGKPSE
jgi:hypothetical protein